MLNNYSKSDVDSRDIKSFTSKTSPTSCHRNELHHTRRIFQTVITKHRNNPFPPDRCALSGQSVPEKCAILFRMIRNGIGCNNITGNRQPREVRGQNLRGGASIAQSYRTDGPEREGKAISRAPRCTG